MSYLAAVFAVLQRHLRHEVAVIATGQRLGSPAYDDFGRFEPHQGIAVEDNGDILVTNLLRVQVGTERILRRPALRLVFIQLEILVMLILVAGDLFFRRLRFDELERFFGVDALLQAELDKRQHFCACHNNQCGTSFTRRTELSVTHRKR